MARIQERAITLIKWVDFFRFATALSLIYVVLQSLWAAVSGAATLPPTWSLTDPAFMEWVLSPVSVVAMVAELAVFVALLGKLRQMLKLWAEGEVLSPANGPLVRAIAHLYLAQAFVTFHAGVVSLDINIGSFIAYSVILLVGDVLAHSKVIYEDLKAARDDLTLVV